MTRESKKFDQWIAKLRQRGFEIEVRVEAGGTKMATITSGEYSNYSVGALFCFGPGIESFQPNRKFNKRKV